MKSMIVRETQVDQGFNELYIWIGATDEVTEGRFVWLDGTPVTYADWQNDAATQSPVQGNSTDWVGFLAPNAPTTMQMRWTDGASIIKVTSCVSGINDNRDDVSRTANLSKVLRRLVIRSAVGPFCRNGSRRLGFSLTAFRLRVELPPGPCAESAWHHGLCSVDGSCRGPRLSTYITRPLALGDGQPQIRRGKFNWQIGNPPHAAHAL